MQTSFFRLCTTNCASSRADTSQGKATAIPGNPLTSYTKRGFVCRPSAASTRARAPTSSLLVRWPCDDCSPIMAGAESVSEIEDNAALYAPLDEIVRLAVRRQDPNTSTLHHAVEIARPWIGQEIE